LKHNKKLKFSILFVVAGMFNTVQNYLISFDNQGLMFTISIKMLFFYFDKNNV